MDKIEIKSELRMPNHIHPHGVANTQPNDYRIWICEECSHIFTDEEIRTDVELKIEYHICKSHPCRKGQRCESRLEPFLPDDKAIGL